MKITKTHKVVAGIALGVVALVYGSGYLEGRSRVSCNDTQQLLAMAMIDTIPSLRKVAEKKSLYNWLYTMGMFDGAIDKTYSCVE